MTDQVTLTLWRDHDEDARPLPAIAMGTRQVAADDPAGLAAALYREGVRQVTLHGVVDLSAAALGDSPTPPPRPATDGTAQATVARLLLLAQLTSWAVVVDWEVRLGAGLDSWWLLNHLYPPRTVLDPTHASDATHADDPARASDATHADDPARASQLRDRWRQGFYLCKCVWRQGPGFIEVRDRRAGSLSRFVIDDPDYLTAIERLSAGCPIAEVPGAVLADVAAEGLTGRVGDHVWWLPYRVRRWPSAPLVV